MNFFGYNSIVILLLKTFSKSDEFIAKLKHFSISLYDPRSLYTHILLYEDHVFGNMYVVNGSWTTDN